MSAATPPYRRLTEPLQGAWLTAARGVWLLLAGFALVFYGVGLGSSYYGYSNPCSVPTKAAACEHLSRLGLTVLAPSGLALYSLVAVSLMVVSWLLMSCLVFWRGPQSPALLVISLGLMTGCATDLTGRHLGDAFFGAVALYPALVPLGLACTYAMLAVSQISVVAMVLLVPSGRFRPRWTAWLALVWSGHALVNTLYHNPFNWFSGSRLVEIQDETFAIVMPFALMIALWYRHRFLEGEQAKVQLEAIFPSMLAFIAVYLGFSVWLLIMIPPVANDSLVQFATHFVQIGVQSAIGAWFGIAVGVSVLRHNLFGTDIVVGRALIYGGLSGILIFIYLGAVYGVGSLLGFTRSAWFAAFATALIALLFEPVRTWLTLRVNRTLYGVRGVPFEKLVGFSRHLHEELLPQDYIANIAQTLSKSFNLPYVRIVVVAAAAKAAVTTGRASRETTQFPIMSQRQQLGEIEVAVNPGEILTAEEHSVLAAIAGQLGISIRSLALTAELRAVQSRLVMAREEERRRLQRDLHDGLGPTLAAQALVAGSARQLLKADPEKAARLLTKLEDDLYQTLQQVRALVYRLRPPDLHQLGLAGALRPKLQEIAGDRLKLELTLPKGQPVYPAAAEVAAYYIVTEAVTNVVRHACARSCRVNLRVTGGLLELSVGDDGVGFSDADGAGAGYGVGVASMRERAQELGGTFTIASAQPGGLGTLVTASLPLFEVERRRAPEARLAGDKTA